ncbi:glycogen debranching protein GlgX [Acidisoma sp.]|uniref:glycogen debranching protein GlgX n=1 Tax=Acidisoma sp. TaxID=1872115 RepID=UPI003B00B8F8
MSRRRVTSGRPEPLGVTLDADGINIGVFSAHATAIELCLFDEAGNVETDRILLPARSSDVFHGHIGGIAAGTRYGLRAYGPWAPREGHRFNPSKLLIDPYATALDRPFVLHSSMFDWPPGTEMFAAPNQADSAPFMPKAIVEPPGALQPESDVRLPPVPEAGQVIYEMHVRGFSKLRADIPEPLRGTYAALTEPPLLDYLRGLGVGAVEFMPSSAWLDERHLPPLGLTNYWGYNPVAYMAPDPRLAPGGFAEIRAATDALRASGIGAILDVVYNHTGEGDMMGPTVSFRGLDHRSYYRLDPQNPAVMVNVTGCGNTLAVDHPMVLRLVMDSLRLWARRAGLSGFRFDLAATIARNPSEYDVRAPFLQAVAQDPELRDLSMIAEPWDIGMGGYQLGRFPPPWTEWNDRYRDTMRRFWRGDGGIIGEVATRFAGSSDLFGGTPGAVTRSVNFITAHDGFTLADLVSYSVKHNAANGENNHDGTTDNISWNHYIEGPSDDPAIVAARQGEVRAMLATLMLSRGVPMLAAGDELGRSQGGNNNAYAQDTPVSWMDWAAVDHDLAAFASRLILARRACPALADLSHLTGQPVDGSLRPDVVWRRPDGRAMEWGDWNSAENRTLIADLYRSPAEGAAAGSRALVVLHAGWAGFRLTLPETRPGQTWRRVIDSAAPAAEPAVTQGVVDVAPRSAMLFVGEFALAVPAVIPEGGVAISGTDASARLARLAEAAGLGHDWWDISGVNHVVPDDSKRALLRAMRLPADTSADIDASLYSLSLTGVFAALPPSLVVTEGNLIGLPIGPDLNLIGRAIALDVFRQDGSRDRLVVTPQTGALGIATAPDGRTATIRTVTLPAQPPGRHRIVCQDGPTPVTCLLTVAPARCYLPPGLGHGGRRFGLAAHLYTLRRAGDQGIGDFSTLAAISALTADEGGAIIGLNPLHALFPENREHASPYSPSDRRFLDPIYVDVANIPFLADRPEVRAALAAEAPAFADLRRMSAVDYPAVWASKRRVLAAAAAAMSALPAGHPAVVAFGQFVAEGGDSLQRFATFEAISAAYPKGSWRDWPEIFRAPDSAPVRDFAAGNAAAVRLSGFMQWVADHQLAEADASARSAGLSLGFYRDLAVGTAPVGAEAWSEQDLLMTGVSIGAPPDPFSMEGQKWGLPPPNPVAMIAEGFAGFGALLRANMRHAGALRIDHVLGLNRLFLIPDGARATEGAYLAYPRSDLLGITALESQAAECLVVGEDLGTVPDGVRAAMEAHGLLSYRVLWFERDGEAFRPPSAYPGLAAACVSTHDLPTLAGWWIGADIDERLVLGLSDAAEAAAGHAARRREKDGMLAALAGQGLIASVTAYDPEAPLAPALAGAIHAFISATPCLLDLVQADDLAAETVAVNLPGTDAERANWRRRIGIEASALWGTPIGTAVLEAVGERSRTVS